MTNSMQLGDWFRSEVRPRLTVELVYGGADVRWTRAGEWRARPCPLHNGARDSFHVHPGTLGWRCHSRCQDSGDVVAFVMRRDGVPFVEAARRLAALVGEELPGRGAGRRRRRAAVPPRSPPAARPPPTYKRLPADAVAALWGAARPVTDDASASDYLASRALDPVKVEERDLARVLPEGAALPWWWARRRESSWVETGHRLIFPMYGVMGRLESVRARLVRPPRDADELKALAPSGANVGGLVLADDLGRGMLAGDSDALELVRRAGLWVTEGEPDFLAIATAWGETEDAPAVLGLVAGAWTADLAARAPNGCTVRLAVDCDEAGEKYAAAILRTFAERMRSGRVTVKRWRPRA